MSPGRLARKQTADQGESLVAEHLQAQGFQIVARNARVGRLEIDVIARRGELLVFCEVRTRTSADFLDPIVTIDRHKVERVRRAAAGWLQTARVRAEELRFDAASVILGGATPSITYYEAAF